MLSKSRAAFSAGIAVSLILCLLGGNSQVQASGVPFLVGSAGARWLAAAAGPIFSQPPDPNGGCYIASENENNYDQYVWDDFTLASTQIITEIHWRGAYDPALIFFHQPLDHFTIAVYPSAAGVSEPAVSSVPLREYQVLGNAGETPAGTFGGVVMYDYTFVLPSPFLASGGTMYWVYLEGNTPGIPPDWCIAKGLGGDSQHFHGSIGVGGGRHFDFRAGDTAFTFWGPLLNAPPIYLPLVFR